MRLVYKFAIVTIAVISVLLVVAGCGSQSASPPPATEKVWTVSENPVTWKSDGLISDNEYTSHQKIGKVDVYSRVDGNTVIFGLVANTDGYLAIGIGAEQKMKGADILMCSMQDGQAVITEEYSAGPMGPHSPKDSGNVNISQISGSLQSGMMTIEVRRKMSPGGSQDKPLKIGENRLIWAIGDGLGHLHTSRGSGIVVLVR